MEAQNLTSALVHTSSQKILDVMDNTAQQLSQHNLNHADMVHPLLVALGFVPGFVFGLLKG